MDSRQHQCFSTLNPSFPRAYSITPFIMHFNLWNFAEPLYLQTAILHTKLKIYPKQHNRGTLELDSALFRNHCDTLLKCNPFSHKVCIFVSSDQSDQPRNSTLSSRLSEKLQASLSNGEQDDDFKIDRKRIRTSGTEQKVLLPIASIAMTLTYGLLSIVITLSFFSLHRAASEDVLNEEWFTLMMMKRRRIWRDRCLGLRVGPWNWTVVPELMAVSHSHSVLWVHLRLNFYSYL